MTTVVVEAFRVVAITLIALCLVGLPAAHACDPIQEPPVFLRRVPSPEQVLGFELGARAVTVPEIDAYLAAVGNATDRVILGTLPRKSVLGRSLNYAIVSQAANLSPTTLAAIRANISRLRDPATSSFEAGEIARITPAIIWIAGSVHGNEKSGTDAALKVLYELSDRSDCAALQIINNAVVVILPTQNPDGREADVRRNANGFDMNRDWFSATQPEVIGKLEVLTQYQPVLFIDAHEMGTQDYFFPPNADPYYHEASAESIDWINNLYGSAMKKEFARQQIPFFNEATYDLFYAGYGDAFPTLAFNAAGMTFEKCNTDRYPEKTAEQYVSQWVSISTLGINKEAVLVGWHRAHVTAFEQGVQGLLQPNKVYNPGNDLKFPVPDLVVRNYFIRNDDPNKQNEVATVILRLQRMGVVVEQLIAPLTVPDFRAYGRNATSVTLPAGTYVISMAQGTKHFVQDMLHENTYVPFGYFYDVTCWSSPLLENIVGGFAARPLSPTARTRIADQVSVVPQPRPSKAPSIAVLKSSEFAADESYDWLIFKLTSDWALDYKPLLVTQVSLANLASVQVLLVPNVIVSEVYTRLGSTGRAAIESWVNNGGRYIGWEGGAALASRIGISSASFTRSTNDCPGALFRINIDPTHPFAVGVGAEAYQFYSYMDIMQAPAEFAFAVFPSATSADWLVSGFQEGAEELGGSTAGSEETVGQGSVVVFAMEVNFRAFTTGTSKLVYNAIFTTKSVAPASTQQQRQAAMASTQALMTSPGFDLRHPIRVVVRGSHATQHNTQQRVLNTLLEFGITADQVTLVHQHNRLLAMLDNPQALGWDEHPWLRLLPAALKAHGLQDAIVHVSA